MSRDDIHTNWIEGIGSKERLRRKYEKSALRWYVRLFWKEISAFATHLIAGIEKVNF